MIIVMPLLVMLLMLLLMLMLFFVHIIACYAHVFDFAKAFA
jgi:hypothetical protein